MAATDSFCEAASQLGGGDELPVLLVRAMAAHAQGQQLSDGTASTISKLQQLFGADSEQDDDEEVVGAGSR